MKRLCLFPSSMKKRRANPTPEPPTQRRLSRVGDVGILLFCVVGFAAMILVPPVALLWEAMLVAAAVAAPLVLLVLILRGQGGPATDPVLPLIAAGSYVFIGVNGAAKRGQDWRLGITILLCILWVAVAGVAWAKKR